MIGLGVAPQHDCQAMWQQPRKQAPCVHVVAVCGYVVCGRVQALRVPGRLCVSLAGSVCPWQPGLSAAARQAGEHVPVSQLVVRWEDMTWGMAAISSPPTL